MKANAQIRDFLSAYNETVAANAFLLRELILKLLPGVTEQLDVPAKMVAYCYGQKYADLICVIIPSKKGLKLGFNRGVHLPDPAGLLKGSGKITRYVPIGSEADILAPELKALITAAFKLYQAAGLQK